jgi:hypothetical protein
MERKDDYPMDIGQEDHPTFVYLYIDTITTNHSLTRPVGVLELELESASSVIQD